MRERRRKALEVERRLTAAFGPPAPDRGRDVIHELVHAVLSQNTSRANYQRAYDRLVERYPRIEELADAPLEGIEEAIRPGGLSRQKSVAIKSILTEVFSRRGGYSLEFLADMEVAPAREFLTSLPGVGPKTASVVLMFSLGREVLPVDTHVLRTARRLGLIDGKAGAERAERELEELYPPHLRPGMHLNLVRLGREICRARGPLHEICPLNMLCESFSAPPAPGRKLH